MSDSDTSRPWKYSSCAVNERTTVRRMVSKWRVVYRTWYFTTKKERVKVKQEGFKEFTLSCCCLYFANLSPPCYVFFFLWTLSIQVAISRNLVKVTSTPWSSLFLRNTAIWDEDDKFMFSGGGGGCQGGKRQQQTLVGCPPVPLNWQKLRVETCRINWVRIALQFLVDDIVVGH